MEITLIIAAVLLFVAREWAHTKQISRLMDSNKTLTYQLQQIVANVTDAPIKEETEVCEVRSYSDEEEWEKEQG